MNLSAEKEFAQVLSKTAPEREIELNFVRRFVAATELMTVTRLHELAVSGKFNELFPPPCDEGPVPLERFDDVKPFDYADWAKRNNVPDKKPAATQEPELA